MLSATELQRARELARRSKGDALGVGSDAELNLALADAAARRFFHEGPSLATLEEWASVIAEIQSSEALSQELSEELGAHEQLISTFRRFLSTEYVAQQPSVVGLAVSMALELARSAISPLLVRVADVKTVKAAAP